MVNSLTTLNLNNSTNFSSNMSVIYLAQMLAKAQNLKLVKVATYEQKREIEIQV